jgi:lipopolysaccharide/colanic/teichoic acid biosynthesis glycosyltransferase
MGKRVFDILIAASTLLVLAVPLILVCLAIKLFDGGSVFFRQKRIGWGARPFWLYKFRTMKASDSGPLITTEGDSRITPVGRLLRRWKIDELPQLWNILRGDMSIVGPRPEAERFVSHYTPEQRVLLEEIPGLAGMSQLVYPHEAELLRNCENAEDVYVRQLLPKKLAVDLQYKRTRTFWSDMRLLAEIVLLILGKSYRIDRHFRIAPAEEPAVTSDS